MVIGLVSIHSVSTPLLPGPPPQPFDEYCITRKELHELLKKHHKTAIELEREKEEKLRFLYTCSFVLTVAWQVYFPAQPEVNSSLVDTNGTYHFILYIARCPYLRGFLKLMGLLQLGLWIEILYDTVEPPNPDKFWDHSQSPIQWGVLAGFRG